MKEGAIDLVSIAADVPADVKAKVDAVKAGLRTAASASGRGPIVDNTGKEVLAKDVVADDAFLGGVKFFVKVWKARFQAVSRCPSSSLASLDAGKLAGPRGDDAVCGIEPQTASSGPVWGGPALGPNARHMTHQIDFSRIPNSAVPGLLARAPKAELHMHIEGSAGCELTFQLAARHGITFAVHASVEALREAMDFEDLQSFLDLYYACADVPAHGGRL